MTTIWGPYDINGSDKRAMYRICKQNVYGSFHLKWVGINRVTWLQEPKVLFIWPGQKYSGDFMGNFALFSITGFTLDGKCWKVYWNLLYPVNIWHWLRLPGLGNNNEKLGLPERLSAWIQFRFRNLFHRKISGNRNFICYYYPIQINAGNRSQSLNILKVIFLKNKPFRFKETLVSFNNKLKWHLRKGDVFRHKYIYNVHVIVWY